MKKTLDSKNKFNKEIFYALSILSQLGLTMLSSIGLGFFIGYWLDRFFNTSPIFLLIFIILGVMTAFRTMYIMTKQFWNKK